MLGLREMYLHHCLIDLHLYLIDLHLYLIDENNTGTEMLKLSSLQ